MHKKNKNRIKVKKNKILVGVLLLIFSVSFCNAQLRYEINLSKIIFSSSRCNGTCPDVNLEIDSAKNIFVSREYYKNKSEVDSTFTGNFKGNLSTKNYKKLIYLLQACDINTLEFPKVNIYDVVYTTITVFYNGKKKSLSSASPPNKAKDLIAFLRTLADDNTLKRTIGKSNTY
jgi:Domain of unknown function (DUF6438)